MEKKSKNIKIINPIKWIENMKHFSANIFQKILNNTTWMSKNLNIIAQNIGKNIFCFVYYKESCMSIVHLKRTAEIVTFFVKRRLQRHLLSKWYTNRQPLHINDKFLISGWPLTFLFTHLQSKLKYFWWYKYGKVLGSPKWAEWWFHTFCQHRFSIL